MTTTADPIPFITTSDLTSTFADTPEWVIDYPSHWPPERVAEVSAQVRGSLANGDRVLFLPDGVYMRSTRNEAILSQPIVGEVRRDVPLWLMAALLLEALGIVALCTAAALLALR